MRRTRLIGAIACAVGALALAPAAAPAAVQVGSSGWQWGNPLPQGNTIRAMSFACATGLRSRRLRHAAAHDDAGATWTGLPAGTFTNLTEVQAIDGAAVLPAAAASRGARTTAARRSRAAVHAGRVQLPRAARGGCSSPPDAPATSC